MEIGPPYVVPRKKIAARLLSYRRLDLGATYRFTFVGMKRSLASEVINAYDNKNVFSFDRKTRHRVDGLHFFPSITLRLEC